MDVNPSPSARRRRTGITALLAVLSMPVGSGCRVPVTTTGAPGTPAKVSSAPMSAAPIASLTPAKPGREVAEARERLETVRQSHGAEPRWDLRVFGCMTDGKSPCKAGARRLTTRRPIAEEAAAERAYRDYLDACRSAGVRPEGELVLEYSELELSLGDVRDFLNPDLWSLAIEYDDPSYSARALLLVLHGLYAAAQDPKVDLHRTILARLADAIDRTERPVGSANSPEAADIARIVPPLRLWTFQQLRNTHCSTATGVGTGECIFSEHAAKILGPQHPDTPQYLLEGALARRARGDIETALRMLNEHLAAFPGHATTQNVRLALADTYEMVLDLGSARDHYAQFVEHGRGDERLAEMRLRWVILAFVTRELPEAAIEALLRGDVETRQLAVAVRFRSLVDRDVAADLDDVLQYIQRLGQLGGDLRLALAHLLAARLYLRESCPKRGDSLCVELVPGQMLGRVLPREARSLAQARKHLASAESLLSAATRPSSQFGPPLDIEAAELSHARLELAFLKGDLGAESALAKRPPATFEATRTQEWFVRRSSEVETMTATYDGATAAVEAELQDRYIARSSARKAQVYEADTTLLETVALAVASSSEELSLVRSLNELASSRRRQAFEGYRRCLKAIAARGRDSDNVGALCRAGVGRLTRHHDDAMEYTVLRLPG